MAEVKMEIDSCRATLSNMGNVRSELLNQMTTLKNAVSNMVGTTWVAPGANTFQSDFESWHNSMIQTLNQLEQTWEPRLKTEIDNWEREAATA